MWIYHIKTGIISDGVRFIPCYSGAPGMTFNNPDMIMVHLAGAIPIGKYVIEKAFHDPIKGRMAMHLTPDPANQMFGRSAFMIHADSIAKPGHASEGCIVSCGPEALRDREYIDAQENRNLEVVAQ